MKRILFPIVALSACFLALGCPSKKGEAPEPTTGAAPTAPVGKKDDKPAAAPTLSKDQSKKQNEYIEVSNRLTGLQRDLENYGRWNSGLSKAAKLTSYSAPSDRSYDAENLAKAIALPGKVPELDAMAAELSTALNALSGTTKTLKAYGDSKEYLTDGGKKARELSPTYVEQQKKVIEIANRFSTAIDQMTVARDTARLKSLKAGTLEYELLSCRLSAKALIKQATALEKPTKADIDAFKAKVESFSKDVEAMKTAYEAPEGQKMVKEATMSTFCDMSKNDTVQMVGAAREFAAALESRKGVADKGNDLIKKYNDSVDHSNRCPF